MRAISIIFIASKANKGGGISICTSERGIKIPNFIMFQEPHQTLYLIQISQELVEQCKSKTDRSVEL